MRADLDKQPAQVRAMFDSVARRYDLTNDVLSLGQDRRWRRRTTAAVAAQPGERILDLAAGTGTSSAPFEAAGAHVVACDFSLGMLRVGKSARPTLAFTAGDATRLPFADATFDAVTMSFGLRNVVQYEVALAEMLRVTRPWRPAGRVRVQLADVGAVPAALHRVPDEGATAGGPAGLQQPRGVRVPRGVDSCLARPSGARAAVSRCWVARRHLGRSFRRDRRVALRPPTLTGSRRSADLAAPLAASQRLEVAGAGCLVEASVPPCLESSGPTL
jgi:SAM-dependent methyltransferase